jgi:hypothetical protein
MRLPAQSLQPREEYHIPLAKLSVSFDEETHAFQKVRISYEGQDDYSTIARNDDQFVHVTRNGVEKHLYQEPWDQAFAISDFEARELDHVCKTFIETLKGFEGDLQKERWGRCLYLDAFMPRFLRGFYYLYCAARNNIEALPLSARVADSMYDVSLNSPVSDARLAAWRTGDNIIKLRIITKELAYQLETWQKKELENPKRNKEISYGADLEEAFSLFVRTYFVIKSQPTLAAKKK